MTGEITDSIDELNEKVANLEVLVIFLAKVALCHEYSKDLHRAASGGSAEKALQALANDDDIAGAIRALVYAPPG